jgi:hypothetical protein
VIGFKFLILGKENKPLNHGTIIEKVTEGKYLCQFTRIPTSCRVVDVTEIQGWNLFPTDDGMNEFIAALEPKKPPAPPPADPPKVPPIDPPKTNGSKRNAKKSKAKKKAQAKK